MKHQRRPKPARRTRRKVQRDVPAARLRPARRYRIWPDRARHPGVVVEVRLCRDARGLRDAGRWCCDPPPSTDAGGRVWYWWHNCGKPRRYLLQRGGVVARLYLNRRIVMNRWTEIPAHECGHAALAYSRWMGVDVHDDEEVACYALGRLTAQLMRILWAEWGRS